LQIKNPLEKRKKLVQLLVKLIVSKLKEISI